MIWQKQEVNDGTCNENSLKRQVPVWDTELPLHWMRCKILLHVYLLGEIPIMEKKIKCKFCEWEIVKYYTDRCGNVRGIDLAIERLDYHVLIEHPAEHAEIQRVLEENCADRQRDYDRDENLYGSRLDWPRR